MLSVNSESGNIGDPGNHLGSVAQALHRGGIQSVVASRYPLSVAGSNILAEALYRAILVDLHPLERALPLARARLARLTQHLDWASLQLYAREADGDDTRPVVLGAPCSRRLWPAWSTRAWWSAARTRPSRSPTRR
ncbi:MAG: CHAT domain-containing protein [Nannocystis sp.]|nr:CHAT domain-containing protein [Nannocystis sp.]MBK8263521.1 CHAT domain-containing protein [Nannocystis sp.]